MSQQRIQISGPLKGKKAKSVGGSSNYVWTFEGDYDIVVEDLVSYVQVRMISGTQRWTYIDPKGDLRINDLVEVPFGFNNKLILAHVVELGKDNYNGPFKSVLSRLHKEAL